LTKSGLTILNKYSIFSHGSTVPVGLDLIYEFPWSHSDPPLSAGLICTIDRFVAETSTWQHTTVIRDWHSSLQRDSNPQF